MNHSKELRQKKVLIYLYGSLGDTIVAVPALRAIRRHFQDEELVLLHNIQNDNLAKVSETLPEGLVDRHIAYKNKLRGPAKISEFYLLWRRLRGERFDTVVYLVNSERRRRSILRDKSFFRLSGINNFVGFHPFSKAELYPVDPDGRPALTPSESVFKLDRLLRDGVKTETAFDEQPFFEFSSTKYEPVRDWLADNRQTSNSRLIAIAPGCKTLANAWPIQNFIEIGRRLIAHENCELMVVGGPAEAELGEEMVSAWGSGINAAGMFTVLESGFLLSLCDLYVGLDTGTTHLASAVGTRCFAIYGERNNPGVWFPNGRGHRIIYHKVECAGCRLFECPLQEHPCMRNISIEAAWTRLREFVHVDDPDSETSVIAV